MGLFQPMGDGESQFCDTVSAIFSYT